MKIGTNDWSNFLIDQARAMKVELNPAHIRLFSAHAIELIKWTQKINLTTITDPIKIASHHFLDSMAPARFIPPNGVLLDIGSGGGFPGIPLKVLFPNLSVVLIDASRKKVSFLKHVIRTLKLANIIALHTRAEDLAGHPNYIHGFDVVISRAVTSLDVFLRLATPFLSEGGVIIGLKGQVEKEELNALRNNVQDKMQGPGLSQRKLAISQERYRLPLLNSKRSIITVR